MLFVSECNGVVGLDQMEALQAELLEALRLELKRNRPRDRHTLPRLLLLIPLLVQINEELQTQIKGHLFDSSEKFTGTHELLAELFDLF